MKRAVGVAAALAVFYVARGSILPSSAPVWLRGPSPFGWSETRAEKKRCIAFGEMMGPGGRTFANYGDDRTSELEVEIERTLRAGDSLVFEGRARRGRTTQILFHCATANVHGHPGEHHTALSQPWAGVTEDWAPVHELEARLERECADSVATILPDARVSRSMLVLRPVSSIGRILARATDTTSEIRHMFACDARPTRGGDYAVIGIQQADPDASP